MRCWRSGIWCRFLDQGWKRIWKITDFALEQGRGFKKGTVRPYQIFCPVPIPFPSAWKTEERRQTTFKWHKTTVNKKRKYFLALSRSQWFCNESKDRWTEDITTCWFQSTRFLKFICIISLFPLAWFRSLFFRAAVGDGRFIALVMVKKTGNSSGNSPAEWIWSDLVSWISYAFGNERCKHWHRNQPHPKIYLGKTHNLKSIQP